MSNMIKLGKMVLNTDFIQNIFEDPDSPGTWLVITQTPLAKGRRGLGPAPIPCLVFSGEEGAALKWYVDNFVHDITKTHADFLAAEVRPKKGRLGSSPFTSEAAWDTTEPKRTLGEVIAIVRDEERRLVEDDGE